MSVSKVPCHLVGNTLTVFPNGRVISISSDHPNFERVKKALRDGATAAEIEKLCDRAKAVQKFGKGKLEVTDGSITYKGQPVHNTVVTRIFDLMTAQLPCDALVNFLEKLLANPSRSSQQEAYDFLNHRGLALTPEGDFLAYRKVTNDYKDFYTGKVDNSIGQTVEMDRGQVDDDRARQCSYGFHVGDFTYPSQHYHPGSGRIILVRVSPADVVSVPTDYDCCKMRVCKYTVVKDVTNELSAPVYTSTGDDYEDDSWDYEDDSWDDEDDYDDDYFDDEVSVYSTDYKSPKSKTCCNQAKALRRDSRGRFC